MAKRIDRLALKRYRLRAIESLQIARTSILTGNRTRGTEAANQNVDIAWASLQESQAHDRISMLEVSGRTTVSMGARKERASLRVCSTE